MELNPRRPAHLHAGSVRPVRPKPYSRAEWRRHLHKEPPGLLRRLHGLPRLGASSIAGSGQAPEASGAELND